MVFRQMMNVLENAIVKSSSFSDLATSLNIPFTVMTALVGYTYVKYKYN